MSFESIALRAEALAKQAEKERRGIDERWSSQAKAEKQREIAEWLAGEIEPLPAEASAELEEQQTQSKNELYKEKRKADPEQWSEATSRAPFVREDVGRLTPDEILQLHAAALEAGDTTGAWLIEREAQRHFDTLLEAEDLNLAERASVRNVARALHERAWGKLEQKHKGRETRILSEYRETVTAISKAQPPGRLKLGF